MDPYKKASERLVRLLPEKAGFSRHIYPSIGLGFLTPADWSMDDSAVPFGSGELDAVKRYEDTKGSIGLKFRVRPVQRNYIHDIQAEIQNQMDVCRKLDTNATVTDVTVFGQPAKLFRYTQSTGERRGDIRIYRVRLFPEANLDILGFIYTDSKDREAFWREVENIVDSTIVDKDWLMQKKAGL